MSEPLPSPPSAGHGQPGPRRHARPGAAHGDGHSGESPTNTNGWMISYADMATLLLAMFIAMSCLNKDQTGVSFERGATGFRYQSMGWMVEGLTRRKHEVVEQQTNSPMYGLDGPGGSTDPVGRSIDGEEERFQRFLNQVRSRFTLQRAAPVSARAAIDFYEPLGPKRTMLSPATREKLAPVLALARQRSCRLQVIVWAPAPAESATARATLQADELRDVLASLGGYDGLVRRRMTAVGQPWRYRDVARPVFSLVLLQDE